jgi:hypothetical protein
LSVGWCRQRDGLADRRGSGDELVADIAVVTIGGFLNARRETSEHELIRRRPSPVRLRANGAD